MNKYALQNRVEFVLISAVLLLLSVSVSISAQEQKGPQEIDVVWSKSDGIRPEIFFSNYTSGSWSEPEMISDDYFDNLHPVIDRDSQGVRWVFWRAYDSLKTEIRYTKGSSGEWAENKALSDTMPSNNAPSVVIDTSDTVWVVWSANSGGLDDIYFSMHADGDWSKPALLHETNNSADVLPVIELNQEQQPLVSWKRMQDGSYVNMTSQYDGSAWSEPGVMQDAVAQDSAEASEDLIELPDFIDNGGIVFIRSY